MRELEAGNIVNTTTELGEQRLTNEDGVWIEDFLWLVISRLVHAHLLSIGAGLGSVIREAFMLLGSYHVQSRCYQRGV